jgi:phage shock protein PspC (stress-responsive transcriptional regulator)
MSQSTFNRSDTLLGVCEALGQDLGFNAQWLRVALCLGLFWSPMGVIAAYLAVGVAVYAARWLTPAKTRAAAEPVAEPAAINDDETVELAKAA